MNSVFVELPHACGPRPWHRRRHRGSCGRGRLRDPDVLVHALAGEQRIVPFVVRNDSACAITVTPAVSTWVDCCTGTELVVASAPKLLPSATPFDLQPCGTYALELAFDTKGLDLCACACATVTFDGAICEPIRVAVCIDDKVPVVAVHGVSKLLTWVRYRGFGRWARRYVAPPPQFHDCGGGEC